MENVHNFKTTALAILAAVGTYTAELFGGWSADLSTLLLFMGIDFLLGILVAAVFKKSGKSPTGTLSSLASFKGLCKKGAVLLVVLIANRLDVMSGGGHAVRTLVVLFFLGNEGISILENLGIMGVPFPAFLKNALEVMKDKGDNGDKGEEEG